LAIGIVVAALTVIIHSKHSGNVAAAKRIRVRCEKRHTRCEAGAQSHRPPRWEVARLLNRAAGIQCLVLRNARSRMQPHTRHSYARLVLHLSSSPLLGKACGMCVG
jgi:hypothetical protein